LGRVDPQGSQGSAVRYLELPLKVPSHRSGRDQEAHQGDLRDARPLWVSPRVSHPSAGGLGCKRQEGLQALQGVGTAAAQQDAKSAGDGEAARRSCAGSPAQRCVGDGLCSRPAGDGSQAGHPDRGRLVRPALAGDRCAVQLSRLGRGGDARSGVPEGWISQDHPGRKWQRVRLSGHGSMGLPAGRYARLVASWQAHLQRVH
jgi:hypothetical protein